MYCSSWRICDRAFAGAILFEQLGDDAVERAAVFLRAALPARQVYVMCSSPVPQSQMSRCSSVSSFHGVSSSVPSPSPSLRSIVSATPRRCAASSGRDLSTGRRARWQPCANDFVGSRHEPLGIEAEEFAEAVAREAHALRAVEAEELRRRFVEADAAVGAGEVRGEDDVAGLGAGGAALGGFCA